MFKFMQSPAYWWPVSLNVPAADDPGKFAVVEFDVQFKREDAEQQQARLDDVRAQGLDDATYVRPLITGFRKLYAVDDTEMPFNADSLAALLKVPGAGSAIARAYFGSTDQAAQKN